MKQQDIPKYYPHQEVEQKISLQWVNRKQFSTKPNDQKSFTIVVPPPNITGVLHLGHTLNATIQDVLARRARIDGYNVCWVPGSDHASIATEAKVVEQLRKEHGIEKKDISREEFLRHAEAWKEKHGNIIYEQFKKLGCSMDWDKVTFTLDDHYSKAVIHIFNELYRNGLIYKGARMIHWDTIAQTALSDEEVEYKEEQATLYYVKYYVEHSTTEYITVATQRPETIMGDVAICVHPEDEKYKHYIGKHVIVPIIGRSIPIITDESVDPDFGTGVLKITPAHAWEDYRIGKAYNLAVIATFHPDGTLNSEAKFAVGKKIAEAKLLVIQALEEKGLLLKKENYTTRIGYSQRTGALVEPFISNQWFLKMQEIASPAIEAVQQKKVRFFPEEKFENTYYHWMNNIKDWCISRQLWWGHRIPAWYDKEENIYVAENEHAAYEQYIKKNNASLSVDELKKKNTLTQDPDCLDTWFSSWLWPIESFYGISQKDHPDFAYHYPTSVLVTGHDILFFWVARMIMAGLYFTKEIPFHDVYFTGMVRDHLGRKMSKSLGNSPDLIKLIDEYSADAVRFGVLIASPAGNDLLFDESALLQGKMFNNKLWNVWKLILLLHEKIDARQEVREIELFSNRWMNDLIEETEQEIKTDFDQYKLSESIKKIYALIRNHFCNDYMEWIKPAIGEQLSPHQYQQIIQIWRKCLQMLHPFMPFITEELYKLSFEAAPVEHLQRIDCPWKKEEPTEGSSNLAKGNVLVEIISLIRETKQQYNINKESDWSIYIESTQADPIMQQLIVKQTQCKQVDFVHTLPDGHILIPYQQWRIGMVLANNLHQEKDNEKIKKEMEHQKNLLASIEKKLSNEKFLANAKPETIAYERKKMQDTISRIETLQKGISF